MTDAVEIDIAPFDANELERHLPSMGVLLRACVEDGASIGFVLPFPQTDAEDYWGGKILPELRRGTLDLLVARKGDAIIGTVQLDRGTPPNQAHRAEVRKLLVHPDARRAGVARALMARIEASARRAGRRLLTLDTRTGDAAEPLYRSLGFQIAGVIPDYCRDARSERLDSTTVMYKRLPAADQSAA